MTFVVDASDEHRHEPTDELLWNESWYFDFTTADGSLGGYVRVGLYPNLGRVWYWACVVGEGRRLVTVIDHEVPLPRSPGSLELRSSGLWADQTCEEVLDRWSLGLEAFGVALAEPTDTYGRMLGDQVPLGFDLEWETAGEPFRWPPVVDRYEIPCTVQGEILCGDEQIEFGGIGQRDHSWGVRDWWALGWCWFAGQLSDGTAFHASKPDGIDWAAGYVQRQGSLDAIDNCEVLATAGAGGLPESITLAIGGIQLDVEAVAWSPVLLESDDGRVSRFPRALARFRELPSTAQSSRTGVGWIEFNQPSS